MVKTGYHRLAVKELTKLVVYIQSRLTCENTIAFDSNAAEFVCKDELLCFSHPDAPLVLPPAFRGREKSNLEKKEKRVRGHLRAKRRLLIPTPPYSRSAVIQLYYSPLVLKSNP